MSPEPSGILVNMKAIETSKGGWGIYVQSVAETESGDCFLIKAILEQTLDDAERVRTRRIAVVLPRELNTPAAIDSVLAEIRRCVEADDNDGVVDLSGNL